MSKFLSFREAVEARTVAVRGGSLMKLLTAEQFAGIEELRKSMHGANAGAGLVVALERRDLSVSGGTDGQYGGALVGTEIPEIGVALRSAMVLPRLGARYFDGLMYNAKLPYGNATLSAAWLAENGTASEGAEEIPAPSISPKRVTAQVPVSSMLMAQGGDSFWAWLQASLMDCLATEIERVAIAGTGSGNQPTGILYTNGIGSIVGGTDGAAPDLTDLVDLEHAVTGTADAGRGPCGWILSPKVRRKLRLTEGFTGAGPIWSMQESDRLLGHPAGVTNAAPDNLDKGSSTGVCSTIVFGNFAELFLCLWGKGIVIDVTQDVADAIAGTVHVTATAYVDCAVRSPGAFAAMKDALAA